MPAGELAAAAEEDITGAARWDEATQQWEYVGGVVDTVANTVTIDGEDLLGNPQTATDDETVQVVDPAIAIDKVAAPTIILPNGPVSNDSIVNYTREETRRVDMAFGIGYGDDIDKATAILERLVSEHDLVLDDPAPNIRVHELADSSVNFIVRPWCATDDYWRVYFDVTQGCKEQLEAAGCSIPFPQRDVHFYAHTPLTVGRDADTDGQKREGG